VSEKAYRVILDSIADGVFTVDAEWRITSFNRAAERITGVPAAEAIGSPCYDVFHSSICESGCALRRTLESGKPIVNKAIFIVNAEGERVPISVSTAILTDDDGRVIGGVETFRDLSLVEELRREAEASYNFAGIISRSRRMQSVLELLPALAESDSTVLIEGESGTGKELVARAIHDLSPRREGPMVVLNCAALPDTLLESELFGYKAGAFTGATADRPGRFAVAEGGTIFLDEIGDISPALQVRLLRVLQEKTYEPLGASEAVKADVRVISATNRNLEQAVRDGTFRRDLYYRIKVVGITLPPLRERKEDIPLLVDHFVSRLNRLRGTDIAGLSPEAMAMLMRHDFPGNVRELENAIEHAFVLCPGGVIEPQHLPENLRFDEQQDDGAGLTLRQLEARSIEAALRVNNWNRSATARQLGIHPTTLWRKIKNLNISLPDKDGRSTNK